MNYLEERIKQRAEDKFNKDLSNLVKIISDNPIGRKLELKTEGLDCRVTFVNYSGQTNGTLFNQGYATDYGEKLTNFGSIKEELIKKYIKQESEDILNKLALLKEYLGE